MKSVFLFLLPVCLAWVSARSTQISFLPVDPLAQEKAAFNAGRYSEVAQRLSPETMQQLEGETLARAYLYLAQSWERLGRSDKALGLYQVAVKLYPRDTPLLSGLAWLLHRSGLEEDATPLFEKILQLHPNDATAHLGLAEINAALGLWDDSSSHYVAALKNRKNDADIYRNYAETLLNRRDYAGAAAAAHRALELAPGEPKTILEIAMIQRASGKIESALTTLQFLSAEEGAQSPYALLRGLWLLEARRGKEAETIADAALTNNPADPLALWIRAEARLSQGQDAAALRDLKSLTEHENDAPFIARAARKLLSQRQ